MQRLAKLTILVVLGLSTLVTTASAIGDGKYACIVTKVSYNNISRKIPKKDYSKIIFNIKNQVLTDGTDTLNYNFTLKDMDFYSNNEYMIGFPSSDEGNKIFPFDFKSLKDNYIYSGYCERVKNRGRK